MKKGLLLCLVMLLLLSRAEAQNYDETKVPAYTLPEALRMADGTVVKGSGMWEKKRRPEILTLFEDNVYGQMPRDYDSLRFVVTNEVAGAMGGKAHLKEVDITIWKLNEPVDIHLVLFTPIGLKKPAPAFLLINNREKSNTDPTRAIKSEFWPAEMVVDAGYAIAAFQVDDAAPDNKDTYQEEALRLYPEQLEAGNGMKAIGAWAWAASRVMDYFQQDGSIDAKKVAVVGHSRGGKAALWAGAQDQRFAMVFSNCSGNTGAALSRRRFGETVKVINDRFPHWFADNYKKFNENEAALPVDQHLLVSLIAPRPVYVTSATEDLWADPKGSYLSMVHAQQAYALYGRHPKLPSAPPAPDTPILDSYLGYHNRTGVHNMTAYDWKNFILFANRHFAVKQ